MRQEAAVLVPVYRHEDGNLRMILVRRGEGGVHGGQLAFPGGKRDPGDRTMLDTALRETHEEIGLGADAIEILDCLPAVDTRTTGFRVVPFLARVTLPGVWSLAEGEIEEVIEVDVGQLARSESRGRASERFPSWPEAMEIDFYHVGEHRLWGLTYRIVKPLIPRLLAGEWQF